MKQMYEIFRPLIEEGQANVSQRTICATANGASLKGGPAVDGKHRPRGICFGAIERFGTVRELKAEALSKISPALLAKSSPSRAVLAGSSPS